MLAWEPPDRLLLSWHLQGDWEYHPDPAKASEIEVRFVAEAAGMTRVELEHRHIERHDRPRTCARHRLAERLVRHPAAYAQQVA